MKHALSLGYAGRTSLLSVLVFADILDRTPLKRKEDGTAEAHVTLACLLRGTVRKGQVLS